MLMYINLSKKKRFPITVLAVIVAGLLNGIFCMISLNLSLPVFLDSIFTVMIAALFGLWPGLIVGLLSNFFFEVLSGFPGYYYPFAIVNISTALVTWLHVKYGHFEKASDALWTIISLALINSVVGAILAAIVYGGVTYKHVDSIVRAVVVTGQSVFTSAIFGRILINLVDKGIAVMMVFPIYRYFYRKWTNRDSDLSLHTDL